MVLPKGCHIILVLSGKGGVGKSTVSSQLSLGLAAKGKKVGLLDIDLCGPSIPKILNVQDRKIHQSSEGWLPVYIDQKKMLAIMSIGFLLSGNDEAVIWRGPKKNAMIKQFVNDVVWEDIEYLIVDTPPGTSDEHISIVETLQEFEPDGAVLVTTPQAVSIADVRRELGFCKKAELKVLGIIENMSGYICPHCVECSFIFSTGGGESLAQFANVNFLGRIPIDPNLTSCMDNGQNYAEKYPDSEGYRALADCTDKLLNIINP
uniref:Cytosolic Fe-S cluster assembly factor NUBP2 homolog n=1 Tax=Romanomermis culicivorax TaxID=13658 RepID=A0A915K0P6_ROMCU